MLKSVHRVIRSSISKLYRKKRVREFQEKNEIQCCSIISSNCIGGMLAHDLGLRFDSPTINLWFDASGYIKFLENLPHYLDGNLYGVYFDKGSGYPIGYLDDEIKIRFQHYHSIDEVYKAWKRRCQRVDFDNIAVICTDRDGMTNELLHRFLALPYKKVVFVSHRSMVLNDECVYIPGFEKEKQLPDLTGWADYCGHRYYDKYFDIVKWLN